MKLDKIQILSIIFSVVSAIVSFYYYKQAEDLAKTKDGVENAFYTLRSEMELLNQRIIELNSDVKLVEQLSPEIQKRNSKIKTVKEIINNSIKSTKENHFKTEREFNDYVLSVVEYSEKYRIPVSLILAISRAESNFNPRAISPTKAQGIMQMLPSTTETCLKHLDKDVHDAFYVRDATLCGVWYLRQLKNMFPNDEDSIIKSYNVGPTYMLNYKGENLPEETVNYHIKVTELKEQYKQKIYWEK